MIRVRFATAPSGYLSLRGARVAVANALFALRRQGSLQLRLDDRDTARCKPDFTAALEADLHWLRISWQETIRHSERQDAYRAAAERLKADRRLYPCFETPEELRFKQEKRRRQGKPTVYDRAMLQLTSAQRAAAEANGKRPHWRFRLSDRTLAWDDLVTRRQEARLPAISDPVVIAADGGFLPAFASVVDDIAAGITHVIEGEDSIGNIGAALDLFAALNAEPPRFAHLPSLRDEPGLSAGQRAEALTLRSLRGDGVEPTALAACLASERASACPLPALATDYDLAQAPTRFDPARLLRLNGQVLRGASFPTVADRLPAGATETFWLAVRGDIDLLKEARGWWDVVTGTIIPPMMTEERSFLRAARETLPEEPWDQAVLTRWVGELGAATGRQGPALLAPLRLALTGEENGPDLGGLLPLIGRTRAVNRLRVAAA